jgi:hypothetical protein
MEADAMELASDDDAFGDAEEGVSLARKTIAQPASVRHTKRGVRNCVGFIVRSRFAWQTHIDVSFVASVGATEVVSVRMSDAVWADGSDASASSSEVPSHVSHRRAVASRRLRQMNLAYFTS